MKLIINILIASFFTLVVQAQTVTIYRGGIPLSPGYSTLKGALPNTINGDEVRMSAHTFYESNDTISKYIFIKGTISGTDTTTINGMGAGSVLVLPNEIIPSVTDTVKLQDLIITGGKSLGVGGGIENQMRLLLLGNIIIRGNESRSNGGGISNDAPGELFIVGGEDALQPSIKIYNNITGETTPGLGGGINSDVGNLFISGNVMINNNIALRGGGICINRSKNTTMVMDSKGGKIDISNNLAKFTGGGIAFTAPPMAPGESGFGILLKGNIIISNNTSEDVGGGVVNDDSVLFEGPGIQIINNHAMNGGGALCGFDKGGAGGYSTLYNVLIKGNTAKFGTAGFLIQNTHQLQINNSEIIGNVSDDTNAANALENKHFSTFTNTRIFNPRTDKTRQTEVINKRRFYSDGCWYGESDTTGLFKNIIGWDNLFQLYNWVTVTWSANDGLPYDMVSTFPITGVLKLNTGDTLPAGAFPMLQGIFSASTGSFTPTIANISSDCKITSTYTRPTTGSIIFRAMIDNDSFSIDSEKLSVVAITNPSSHLNIYPNPVKNVLFIDGLKDENRLSVYNLQGQLIITRYINAAQKSVNLETLQNGIYLIRLSNKNGNTQQLKFQKE